MEDARGVICMVIEMRINEGCGDGDLNGTRDGGGGGKLAYISPAILSENVLFFFR